MRHTADTAVTCTPTWHRCAVCGEQITLTRKGGMGARRWVHSTGRRHPARHNITECEVP